MCGEEEWIMIRFCSQRYKVYYIVLLTHTHAVYYMRLLMQLHMYSQTGFMGKHQTQLLKV